jgi:hypothetical protein
LKLQKKSISSKKIQKNKFSASFQYYFLLVFLVSENLVSEY